MAERKTQGTLNINYDPEMSAELAQVAQVYYRKSVRIRKIDGEWYRYGNADGTGDQSQRTRIHGTFTPEFVVRNVISMDWDDADDDDVLGWIEYDLGCDKNGKAIVKHCRERLWAFVGFTFNNVTKLYLHHTNHDGLTWCSDIVLKG